MTTFALPAWIRSDHGPYHQACSRVARRRRSSEETCGLMHKYINSYKSIAGSYGTAEYYFNTFSTFAEYDAYVTLNHPGDSSFFGWQTAGRFKYFFKDLGHIEYLFYTDFKNTTLEFTTDFGEYISRGYLWDGPKMTSAQKQNTKRHVGNIQSSSYIFPDVTAALNALPMIIADEYLFIQMTGKEAWMSVVGDIPTWFADHLLQYFNAPLDTSHKLLIINPNFGTNRCPS